MKNLTQILVALFLCHPFSSMAQDNENGNEMGVKWVKGLSWKEIVKKAKKENKYIFVDCFTTWCGPCKRMDMQVFNNKEVGDYYNKEFISVKLQMDKTKKDNEIVRKYYSTAAAFEKEYGIVSYPTLLFFSPDGDVVHRINEFRSTKSFIKVGQEATRPGAVSPYQRFYSMLGEYKNGYRDYNEMPMLADTAKLLSLDDLAKAIAKDYRVYLLSRPEKEWYTPTNLSFMADFMQGSKDSYFSLFYNNVSLIDSIMDQKGFAENALDAVIIKEEILPVAKLKRGMRSSADKPKQEKEPAWDSIQLEITGKYNFAFAERNVLRVRDEWYRDHHEWMLSARCFALLMKKYKPVYITNEISSFFNSVCWNSIFRRSVNKEEIDAGIKAMKSVVMRDIARNGKGNHLTIDTYANLLYKAGQTQEALKWEEKALSLSPEHKSYIETVDRMKKGKPTWPHYISNDFWDGGLID